MKTILAPTDFSANAENSLEYAANIALLAKAKLILFNVYSVPVPVADVPVPMIPIDEVEKKCLTDLKHLQEKLELKYAGLQIEIIASVGFIIEEILSLIEEKKADMVIMGVTGNGKSSSVFGSTTTAVMKRSKCPIFAIPSGAVYVKPQKVALACDYSAIVSDEVTDKLKHFVHLFDSKLLIFNVLKRAEVLTYEKAAAEVNLENSLCDTEHYLYYPAGDKLEDEAANFIEKNNVDILVMIPHNYSFVENIFHKRKTKQMTFLTKIPLLSIHE
jgi:nucleotide-binding universal stress UspA family protein